MKLSNLIPSIILAGSLVTCGIASASTSKNSKSDPISIKPLLITYSDATFNGVTVGRGGGNVQGNTIVGQGASENSTTGSNTTAMGYYALGANRTGSWNAAFGAAALGALRTGNDNTVFGNFAASNTLSGSSNAVFGLFALEANIIGGGNTVVGNLAMRKATGNSNVAVGFNTASNMIEGEGNTFIGNNIVVPTGTNYSIIIANGVGNQRINVDNFGHVGLGALDPSYQLTVNGPAIATSWNITSDSRLKKNVKQIEAPLSKILKLRGITFDWDHEKLKLKAYQTHDIGVIAQEVEGVFPEAVVTDESGFKSVSYSKLVAPLIGAVKELSDENESLRRDVQEMKTNLAKLEVQFSKLKK